MSDEHKKNHPTYHKSFFQQPRYQIGFNRFEFPDIPTYRQEKNQPICSLANSPSSMTFKEPCIQTNNSNNIKNNNNIINNHCSLNDEHEVSVGGSRVAENFPGICIENEHFEQMLIDELTKIGGPNNLNFMTSFKHLKIHATPPETYGKTNCCLFDHKVLYDISYQSRGITNKSFRVILRNLPPTTNVQKIKKELETLGFSVRQVFNMKHKKTNVSLPLFTVDLEPSDKNEEIFIIDTLLNMDVEFEEPYKKSPVEQCKNCQDFGHTWPDCVFQSRCVRCGKNHASSECIKSKDTPATCALCQGDHPANYKGCRVYKTFRHLRRQIPDEVIESAPQVPMHSEPQVPAHSAPLVLTPSSQEVNITDIKNNQVLNS